MPVTLNDCAAFNSLVAVLAVFGGFHALKSLKSAAVSAVTFFTRKKASKSLGAGSWLDQQSPSVASNPTRGEINFLRVPIPGSSTVLKLKLSMEEVIKLPLDWIFTENQDGSNKHYQLSKDWSHESGIPWVHLKLNCWIK